MMPVWDGGVERGRFSADRDRWRLNISRSRDGASNTNHTRYWCCHSQFSSLHTIWRAPDCCGLGHVHRMHNKPTLQDKYWHSFKKTESMKPKEVLSDSLSRDLQNIEMTLNDFRKIADDCQCWKAESPDVLPHVEGLELGSKVRRQQTPWQNLGYLQNFHIRCLEQNVPLKIMDFIFVPNAHVYKKQNKFYTKLNGLWRWTVVRYAFNEKILTFKSMTFKIPKVSFLTTFAWTLTFWPENLISTYLSPHAPKLKIWWKSHEHFSHDHKRLVHITHTRTDTHMNRLNTDCLQQLIASSGIKMKRKHFSSHWQKCQCNNSTCKQYSPSQ